MARKKKVEAEVVETPAVEEVKNVENEVKNEVKQENKNEDKVEINKVYKKVVVCN